MAFWTFILSLITFNLSWIVDFILGNLFWLFAFVAVMYYISMGRSMLRGLIMAALLIMISVEFTNFFDLLVYTSVGLMLLYLSRMAILLALENTPGWSKHITLAWLLSFIVVIFVYNLFIR